MEPGERFEHNGDTLVPRQPAEDAENHLITRLPRHIERHAEKRRWRVDLRDTRSWVSVADLGLSPGAVDDGHQARLHQTPGQLQSHAIQLTPSVDYCLREVPINAGVVVAGLFEERRTIRATTQAHVEVEETEIVKHE